MRLPFFALPPELLLVEDAAARIRDRLVSEIDLPFARARFDAEHPDVTRRLAENRDLLAGDGDVASLFGLAQGKQALIVASGPTLQHNLATLQAQLQRRRQDYLLISVDTALAFLLGHGIRPDIVVTIDDAIDGNRLPAAQSAQTTLVYYPTVPTAALLAWQGPRKTAYSRSPMYQQLRQTLPRACCTRAAASFIPPWISPCRWVAARSSCWAPTSPFPASSPTRAGPTVPSAPAPRWHSAGPSTAMAGGSRPIRTFPPTAPS